MRPRMAGRLAWALLAVSVLALLGAMVLSPQVLSWQFGEVLEVPVALAFVSVGAFLGLRRPANPIGWLFGAWGSVMSFTTLASSYIERGLLRHPGSLAGEQWAGWAVATLWHPAFALLVFIMLLFPYGQLPSPRWR